eukprot:TRINITY_DN3833_c0_g2_i2.p1 TRINITY_DN3833_c0_g2~~TRINITY_DN3833_c0_g2_i2.p1  ORF type:complete len:343 (-),score=52.26 TRINITY_DN3833_c0_g2_i2:693-1721(-)
MGSVVAIHGCCEPHALPRGTTTHRKLRRGPHPCTQGELVKIAATEIINIFTVAAYHTSVVIGTKEYYFDEQGIISAPAFWSHEVGQRAATASGSTPPARKTEVINVGNSKYVDAGACLFQCLSSFFEKGSYDVLHKNCSTFVDAAVGLLTGQRLDARFSRVERVLVATKPFSVGVLNQVLRLAARQQPCSQKDSASVMTNDYIVNPLADGFSVDKLLASTEIWDLVQSQQTVEDEVLAGIHLVNPHGAMAKKGPLDIWMTREEAEDEDDICYTDGDGVISMENSDFENPPSARKTTDGDHAGLEKVGSCRASLWAEPVQDVTDVSSRPLTQNLGLGRCKATL